MRTKKFLSIVLPLLVMWAPHVFGCQSCFGDYRGVTGGPPQNVQHLAIAVWVLMFIVLTVLGGVGMFSLHLWRHGRAPIQPHEALAEEDLSQYA